MHTAESLVLNLIILR